MFHTHKSALLLTFLVCLAFTCVAPVPASAQMLYGTMVGNVKDSSGAVIPGAGVTATNQNTNESRDTVANDAGMYTFSNLAPGPYTLKVTVAGFKEYAKTNIPVTVNNITREDVTLEVGARTELVTVTAEAAMLQTDKADVHKELNTVEITNLPLSNYRNYQSLIDLVPGSTPSTFQNASVDTPDRALTTNVNGVVRNNNNTRLDGALSIMPWLPHHAAYVAPEESIQTVNISTNSFDAEQGIAGGSAVTVQTKSGTNDFHGVAFDYDLNSAFSAANFFTPKGSGVPKSIINMFGGNLGGPIIKNKLFFFVNYEGMRERDSQAAYATVPTAAMKNGDFSATGTPIYDPNTGDSTGKGRTLFTGGQIPASRLDPITLKYEALVPLPNVPGATFTQNYYGAAPWKFNRDQYDFKGDWVRSSRNTIWMKVSMMRSLCDGQYLLKDAGGPGLPSSNGPGTGTVHTTVGTLGGYYAITPKFMVDGNISAMRYVNHVRPPDYGVNFCLDVLKIPGTNGPDVRQSSKCQYNVSGYTGLGLQDTWIPVDRWDYTYTYTANASWSHGKHDIRFGPDIARLGMNHWQPESGSGPRGAFSFSGDTTALNGGPANNRFNAMAAAMLGLTSTVAKSLQYYDPMSCREWQIAMYFRDRWQVTSNLTLSLGVRWEYYPIMDRGFHGIERYDPDTNKVYIGGYGGVDWTAGTTASKKLIAPRVGIAYRIGKQGVIRTGYGITFDPYDLSRSMRSPYPVVPQQSLTGPRSFIPYGQVANGIPGFVLPDITKGVIDIAGTYSTSTLPKGEFHRGYIQSWNLTYERPLPWNLVWNVGYVATRSTNIVSRGGIPINNAPLGTGNAGRPLMIKWGRSVSTTILQPWMDARYNSLQTSLDRRFTSGLMLKTAYTWSHCVGAGGTSPFGLPELFYLNRGPCNDDNGIFDRRHNFKTAFVYQLPWGPGRRWAKGGAVGAIAGGWQINGIFTAVTGRPFQVTSDSSLLNAPGTSQTPNVTSLNVPKLSNIGANTPFFDPTGFRLVTTPLVYGNWGSSTIVGPGMVNLDFGVFRAFRITEGKDIQFRVEAFNLTNTPHFANPSDTTASNMTFNPDGSVKSSNTFMNITSTWAQDQRCLRFGLRFGF